MKVKGQHMKTRTEDLMSIIANFGWRQLLDPQGASV